MLLPLFAFMGANDIGGVSSGEAATAAAARLQNHTSPEAPLAMRLIFAKPLMISTLQVISNGAGAFNPPWAGEEHSPSRRLPGRDGPWWRWRLYRPVGVDTTDDKPTAVAGTESPRPFRADEFSLNTSAADWVWALPSDAEDDGADPAANSGTGGHPIPAALAAVVAVEDNCC